MTTIDTPTAVQRAEHLRSLASAGDPVSATELAAAEAEERLERLHHEASARRADEAAADEAARRVEEGRAAVQAAWQHLHDPARLADLDALRDGAVDAVEVWLRAVAAERDDWSAMADRATELGFAVDAGYPMRLRGVLGQLGPQIKARARRLLGSDEVEPLLGSTSDLWSCG